MNTRWLENWAFVFYPCWERRPMEWDRLTDWMTLPLTLYRTVFCGLKEGNLNIFCFFNWREKEVKAEKTSSWKQVENKRERNREKETLDRTNNVGLISLWYLLFFTITLQVFLFLLKFLNLLQLNFYCMKAEIIHADIAPEFTAAVAIRDDWQYFLIS